MEWFITASAITLSAFIFIESILGPWMIKRALNRVLGSDKGIEKARAYSEQLQKEALDKGAIW